MIPKTTDVELAKSRAITAGSVTESDSAILSVSLLSELFRCRSDLWRPQSSENAPNAGRYRFDRGNESTI